MPQKTQRKLRDPGSVGFDGLFMLPLENVAAAGAGLTGSTVQARLPLPCSAKLMSVAFNYSAMAMTTGNHLFNIVVGTGAYETPGVTATGSFTLTGSPTTGQNNTYSINSIPVTSAQLTANSLAQQAAADVIAINAAAGSIVKATSVAGVITLTANLPGMPGGALGDYTISGSGAAGDVVTASGAAMTGGAVASGLVVGTPDSFETTGTFNFAAAGNAVFPADQAFTNAVDTPQVFPIPVDQFDVIYQKGTLLTLRLLTPSVIGSITNLKGVLLLKAYDVLPARPYPSDLSFSPANSIG